MKYKVRFIKDSERSDVSFVFEETELEAEDEAAARAAYEAAKSSAPEGALRIDLVRGEGYNWEKVAEDTLYTGAHPALARDRGCRCTRRSPTR